nr:hypothetical protein [Tanacetum cinerariifolium]
MSSDSHATITYTSMSSYEVIVNGYYGIPMDPYVQLVIEAPPSPDYIPEPEAPPSPDYIPGPEAPPSPDYIPVPEYPEYLPPADDMLPAEEQPLLATISHTAESPGYITESEPEMEPEENDGDDENCHHFFHCPGDVLIQAFRQFWVVYPVHEFGDPHAFRSSIHSPDFYLKPLHEVFESFSVSLFDVIDFDRVLDVDHISGYFHLLIRVLAVYIFLDSRLIQAFGYSTIQAFTVDSLLFDIGVKSTNCFFKGYFTQIGWVRLPIICVVIRLDGYAYPVFELLLERMGTPTVVCVRSCPNFSALAGRPFRTRVLGSGCGSRGYGYGVVGWQKKEEKWGKCLGGKTGE